MNLLKKALTYFSLLKIGNWNTHLGSSPGSSSASWSSGSPSPPLSDDGKPEQRNRTTSLSTSDEGIVMDYSEEMPRKKTVSFFFCCLLFIWVNILNWLY